jgi:transposase-like protein
MKMMKDAANMESTKLIEDMPLACADENAAVEFFEEQMWHGKPRCAHCGSERVYKMMDAKTGGRSKRFLWRCHACQKQFTVRVSTVLEESRIPLRHWAYAFWRAASSKKGVAALEIKRHCQISYPSALFLMHRIRLAMTPDAGARPKLAGTVEADETYVGGKPRPGTGPHGTGRGTSKQPVFGMVERGGQIRRRVIADISGKTLTAHMVENVDRGATIMTDEFPVYKGVCKGFAGHKVIRHKDGLYAVGDVSTNTAESSFAILKRGLFGIYHAVSRKHLHRYVNEFDFRWNTRKTNDGNRTALAIKGAQGKRLDYRTLTQ